MCLCDELLGISCSDCFVLRFPIFGLHLPFGKWDMLKVGVLFHIQVGISDQYLFRCHWHDCRNRCLNYFGDKLFLF